MKFWNGNGNGKTAIAKRFWILTAKPDDERETG
jgi:hypothetical protein